MPKYRVVFSAYGKSYGSLRHTKRALRMATKAYFALDMYPTDKNEVAKKKQLAQEMSELDRELDRWETDCLYSQAGSLGIQLPSHQGWWYEQEFHDGTLLVLSKQGQIGARKIIRDERLRTVKFWAGVLIPILSLITAIIALLKR